MEHKRFSLWNAIGAIPYALAHVALGYIVGDALFKLGPFATRAVLFGLAALLALVVLWYLVVRIRRMLPFGLSVLKSMMQGVAENPDVQAWAARHPRLSAFISQRFAPGRFTGLTTTLLGAAFSYIFAIWVATVFDFLMVEPVVLVDTRLANLIHGFWNPELLRGFAHVTALGDLRIVAIVFAGVAAVLVLRKRTATLLGLSVALAGNVVSVAVLKAIFHRPRPELAFFVETSSSFPSGHAAISVAFYGMLFFIAWRQRFLGPVLAALMAVTLAFVIGLGRVYLIEHYLSDVLNGYLVGAMWLVVGIALAEWWRESHAPAPGGDSTHSQ
jgi:membrane-associated phospholipid phosphatase